MTYHKLFGVFLLSLLLSISCQRKDTNLASPEIDALPMQELLLENLQAFQLAGNNWSIAGDVYSDLESRRSIEVFEGTGVLVNRPTESSAENLFLDFEHGDIELKVEFLVPKGSNSGIYFQSRYELQIFDSWGVENPTFGDLGGIYQRRDETRPEGERGFDGAAPIVNASFAPGLWQKFHVLFRAPRFDVQGVKIKNAKFEQVYLNGKLIHEDVEISGPTHGAVSQDETALAPILLQGSHGPVAFRNFKYKTYNHTDSLTLGPLDYTVYEYHGEELPDFDTLSTVLAEGVTDKFDVMELSPRNSHYAIWFSGDLEVPVSGEYLFQTHLNNGGNLYINGELVIPNDGKIDSHSNFRGTTTLGNIIHLEAGNHRLHMSYFQRIFGRQLQLFYEGPNIEKRSMASLEPPSGGGSIEPLIVLAKGDRPELIGGFFNHGNEKRTHTLSVGHREGVHYNFDHQNASLLGFWRDPFADVTQMWDGRGFEQLLVPMNASVEDWTGVPIARANGSRIELYQEVSTLLDNQEYVLKDNGYPVFTYEIDGVSVEDEIRPSPDGGYLIRTLRYRSDGSDRNVFSLIAGGKTIEELPNGLYRVNGNYYVGVDETGGREASIYEADENQLLGFPILRDSNHSEIRYRIIW